MRSPRLEEFRVDGFVGMRDQRSPQYAEGEMFAIYDLWPESLERPSRLMMRPGFKRFTPSGDALRLNNAPPTAFLVAPFGDNSAEILVISGGELWLVDTNSPTVTKMLSTAQLAAATVNITGVGGPPRFAKFNGKIVVLPTGNGAPWTWDGTAGAGIVILTNAPADALDVTVRAGKLFFLKDDSKTIAWSEELQENVGYEAGGFNNAWDLTKINPNPVFHILGDERGLYIFRREGVSLVVGEVNQTFQTTSTRDAIDETQSVGATTRPVSVNGVILFVDGAHRPVIYVPGRGVVRVWQQMPRIWATAAGVWLTDQGPYQFSLAPNEIPYHASAPSQTWLWYDKGRNAYCFAVGHPDTPFGSRIFWFDANTLRLVSIWRPPMTTASGAYHLCYQDQSYNLAALLKVDGDGYCFIAPSNSVGATDFADETFDGVATQVVGSILGPPHGWNQRDVLRFYEALVLVEHRPDVEVKLGFVSARNHKGSLAAAAQTFTADESNTPFEGRVRFVLDELARWVRPQIQVRVTAGSLHGQTGIYGYTLRARVEPTIEAG